MVAVTLDHALVITSSISTCVTMEHSPCRLCGQNHVSKNMVSLFSTAGIRDKLPARITKLIRVPVDGRDGLPTNTSFPWNTCCMMLLCSGFSVSDGQERRWMANERALSNVTRTFTKGTGGGGIPLLVTHTCAVDTRCSFSLLLCPAPLSAWIRG